MKKLLTIILLIMSVIYMGCKKKEEETIPPVTVIPSAVTTTPPIITDGNQLSTTIGFNILSKIKGIWNGPVTSTTALVSYPEWIVDFRPNSENQISAKNELDTVNDIFLSFFVAKYNNSYKIAFRNGGGFSGSQRVSYFLIDSVYETSSTSFYRFSEIVKGKTRAYTTLLFVADSLYLKSYTNKYNTQMATTPHMAWAAKLQDTTSCASAVTHFNFSQRTLTKNFTTTFANVAEAIYYATSGVPANDPYPETAQPYLGKTAASYTFASNLTPTASNKTFLLVTTQPLFAGFSFTASNLKFRSRYVVLSTSTTSFTFNYMHPGTYYYYALYDKDGNNTINSGDWISTTNTTFTLNALGNANTTTQINFVIP